MRHPHTLPPLSLRVRHRLCLYHKRRVLEDARGNNRIKVSDVRYESELGPCTAGTCSMRALFVVVMQYT